MNANIINQFNLLIKQIEAEYLNAQVEGDAKEINRHKFRLSSMKKILNIIKKLDFEITDENDLKGIPGIHTGTLNRVQEILKTGQLKEIKNKYGKRKQSKIDSIQELTNVIGIGPQMAKKLVIQNGITSVKDLKKAIKEQKIKVNDKILLGLKYYGVVKANIPRKEIAFVEKYLIKTAHKIDPHLELMVCGSYRRGKPTSGDIDVMLYHPNVKTNKQILNPDATHTTPYLVELVHELIRQNFLIDHMTDKNYNRKYMGFCRYKKNPVRRIDMIFIPYKSLYTAMLYFTGPYELNTAMRQAAKKRGMLLNEYGLYKIDEHGTKIRIPINSEAQVFEILGMKPMRPQQREYFSTGKAPIVK